jgi:hypothetical protein
MDVADPKFERAFVAMSYLLGPRETAAVSSAGAQLELVSPEARALANALARGSRDARVAALAKELASIALALEAGNLRWSQDGSRS